MKLNEIPAFRQALENVADYSGEKFAYAVYKNMRLADQTMKNVKKPEEYPKNFKEFEDARVAVCENFAAKDENGKPIIEEGNYKIPDADQKKFEDEINALKEKHKDVIEAKKKIDVDYIEYLGTEADVIFHTVEEKYLPKEITARQIDGISSMIVFES